MPQSKELTEFYRAYKKWLDADAPEKEPFTREEGLCYNVARYTSCSVKHDRILDEMTAQFRAAKLDDSYPFNDSALNYNCEAFHEDMHLNPKRIAWVNAHLDPEEN